MTRNEVIEKQIEEIMDEFDFQMVKDMFDHNKWSYGGDGETPSIAELRKTARGLLRGFKPQTGMTYLATGRFFAHCIEDTKEKWLRLGLEFTPTGWSIDEGHNYQ